MVNLLLEIYLIIFSTVESVLNLAYNETDQVLIWVWENLIVEILWERPIFSIGMSERLNYLGVTKLLENIYNSLAVS